MNEILRLKRNGRDAKSGSTVHFVVQDMGASESGFKSRAFEFKKEAIALHLQTMPMVANVHYGQTLQERNCVIDFGAYSL